MKVIGCMIVLFWLGPAFGGTGESKYPADVVPLSKENAFVRKRLAPDFWALSPHLTQQNTHSSCSLATATLVLNGARPSFYLKKGERLFTESSVLDTTGDEEWRRRTRDGGGGISLKMFEEVFTQALHKHGFSSAVVTRVPVTSQENPSLGSFERDLIENESSTDNFIVLNFDQGMIMEEESVGHFAVVGAYDAETKRVLILDNDKKDVEPYWVPVAKVYQAMLRPRGYAKIRIR